MNLTLRHLFFRFLVYESPAMIAEMPLLHSFACFPPKWEAADNFNPYVTRFITSVYVWRRKITRLFQPLPFAVLDIYYLFSEYQFVV